MIGPLGYWYDPAPEKRGKWTKTNFIVRLNNESPEGGAEDTKIKRDQKDRITALDGMLLIKFRDDEVITPKGSCWFERPLSNENTLPLEQDEFFTKDVLGLRTLRDSGRLKFYEAPREHDRLEPDDLLKVVVPLLKGESWTSTWDKAGKYIGAKPAETQMRHGSRRAIAKAGVVLSFYLLIFIAVVRPIMTYQL